MNTNERIIEYLLNLKREHRNNSIQVKIHRNSFNESNIADIGEDALIQTLMTLEANNLIRINFTSPHKNLSMPIQINLLSNCLNYFEIKKETRKKKRREEFVEFRAWLTLGIAFIALVLSIISLLYK